jgi:lantibiotic modifying enzyme
MKNFCPNVKRTGDATKSSPAQPDNRAAARLLRELERIPFTSRRGSPLAKLCQAGAEYGWRQFERATSKSMLHQLSRKARATLKSQLQRTLTQITASCLELEWDSFILAMESLGLGQVAASESTQRMFLRDRASYRLGSLFRRFPVLPQLWSLALRQWHEHTVEVLNRIRKDRIAISRVFFNDNPLGAIKNIRPGLSDPHHGGRSVTLLEFERGRIIYKPRSGRSEALWFELLEWMNNHAFAPKLRAARVLERPSYSWMEYVEAASCHDPAAVRRFYQRLGGMIAAAYLLKAVDCHRENVIAAGEYPVLVDVDALWHVSPVTKTQSLADVLYRTGFFPNSKRRSLQSRSSVLGASRTGKHLARLKGRVVAAGDYAEEIVRGFTQGWKCLIGTAGRRAVFLKRLRDIRTNPRRWIYLATEKYGAIRDASLRPAVLQSNTARRALLERLSSRNSVSRAVRLAEVKALRQLDLPYFLRKSSEAMPADSKTVPFEIINAIRSALLTTRTSSGKEG